MKTYCISMLLCISSLFCIPAFAGKAYNDGINITPLPLEMQVGTGSFIIDDATVFYAEDDSAEKIAGYFAGKIKTSSGVDIPVKESCPKKNFISLKIDSSLDINDEGYSLKVTPKAIDITAKSHKGLFYGMQTIMQLLPAEIESPFTVPDITLEIPAVTILDEPEFGYRGLHLDVCRHFADVDFIKKQLELMAMFKLNTFHWHLTDDQGWRIEIRKYPKLITEGATRIEGEDVEYGPYYYTQEQIREVVEYAKALYIEVIPEIELPGHAVAAVAAYPWLSCEGKPIPVRNLWGVSDDVFCAGNDKVFEFLEDVFDEIIPLFESDYIHIGGDECLKNKWAECPKCQKRIKDLNIVADEEHSAEEKLQSYFVKRIESYLLSKGKKIIGWDEILQGGVAESATIMSWRGEEGGIYAANAGHDVIMTPTESLYLDKYQGSSKILPVTIGGFLPLKSVYSYNPVPEEISPDKKHHVLGAQGNMWNEYNYCMADMEYDIYPRIIALAELTWTPTDRKNYDDFFRRLDNQRVRLDMHDVNYYIPLPEQKGYPSCNNVVFTDSASLDFTTTEPVEKIVYTTDGKEPGLYSDEYTSALTFHENTVLKIRSVLASGKMSPVRTISIRKEELSPATDGSAVTMDGIRAEYYHGYFKTCLELCGRTPDKTDVVKTPETSAFQLTDNGLTRDVFWSTVLTGYIGIPEDGVYYFSTDCELWIDGKYLISNEKDNYGSARKFSRSDNAMALSKGLHPFRLIRLGVTFGGTPQQCLYMNLQMRKADNPRFMSLTEKDYR